MIHLAFDIYGTLIDPVGITKQLQRNCGSKATDFARLWRQKQLEYTFRRGLMHKYRDFSVCVSQALQFTAASMDIELGNGDKEKLQALYLELPAYPDAENCLHNLDSSRFKVYAFSNGTLPDVRQLLSRNNLLDYFHSVISVDAIRTYKPDPAVYRYLLDKCRARATECWLVSGNPFDIIGAVAVGMNAAWIQRDRNVVFDPWEFRPTITLNGLEKLQETILRGH